MQSTIHTAVDGPTRVPQAIPSHKLHAQPPQLTGTPQLRKALSLSGFKEQENRYKMHKALQTLTTKMPQELISSAVPSVQLDLREQCRRLR